MKRKIIILLASLILIGTIACAVSASEMTAATDTASVQTAESQSKNNDTFTSSFNTTDATPTGLIYENPYYGFGIDLGKLSFRKETSSSSTEEDVNAILEEGNAYQELYAQRTLGTLAFPLKESIEISILERGSSATTEENRDYFYNSLSYCLATEDSAGYCMVSKQTINLCGKEWEALDCYWHDPKNSNSANVYYRYMFYADNYYTTLLTICIEFLPDTDPLEVSAKIDGILSEFYPVPVTTPKSTPMPPPTPSPITPIPTIRPSVAKECGHYYHDAETDELLSQGEIGSVGYFSSNVWSNTTPYYLIVKNNTERAVEVRAKAVATRKDGETIECPYEATIEYLDPGAVSYLTIHFFDVHDVVSVEYTIITSEPTAKYKPCLPWLSMTIYDNPYPSDVSVLLTNNGMYTEYDPTVGGIVLFFDEDNQLIYAADIEFYDCDGEIKTGNMSADCAYFPYRQSYDHVSVYLHAYRRNMPGIKPKQVVIKEDQMERHTYTMTDDRSGETLTFLTLKNKASEDICVKAWCVFRDEIGDVRRVHSGVIDTLAPGQTTILNASNYGEDNWGEPEWIISAGTFSDGLPMRAYDDILPYLTIDSTVNGRDVTVSVKNRHKKAADYVSVTALFFDEADTLVGNATQFFYNIEYEGTTMTEFSSGVTVTKVLTCPVDFARVELYAHGGVYLY